MGCPSDMKPIFSLLRHQRLLQLADVPIIMVTALWKVDERVRGLRAGADYYVVKPITQHELLAGVEAVLRRARVAIAKAISPEPQILHCQPCSFMTVDRYSQNLSLSSTTIAVGG